VLVVLLGDVAPEDSLHGLSGVVLTSNHGPAASGGLHDSGAVLHLLEARALYMSADGRLHHHDAALCVLVVLLGDVAPEDSLHGLSGVVLTSDHLTHGPAARKRLYNYC
jgi:hypothetical protein